MHLINLLLCRCLDEWKELPCKIFAVALFYFSSFFVASQASAQTQDSLSSTQVLKKMSLEELMNLEVTSVSRQPEKLSQVASAVQVITSEDIRWSGAATLPEALRLATNLQVAQVNASQWAVSARGFTNVLSNKLLVLVDGRVIYTPMYAGVFWDIQHLLLEDIDRIEVISGPGGTLWGANAVNGVINIITKSTKDTKGFFAEAAAGSQLRSLGSLRYGGQIANGLTYRVYGTAFKRENTYLIDGQGANDYWALGKGGFRMDWETSDKNLLTLQGDIYEASPRPDGGRRAIAVGGNLLARWTHTLSDKADLQVQAFYDQTYRKFPNTLQEDLKTYDLDFQHRLQAGGRNEVIWGAGIRLMRHEIDNTPLLGFLPENKTLHVYNIFVQDKLNLVKDRLSLTLGSKLEHNNYSGFQLQPNARLAYTPTHTQLIWAALSRAVRNPARTDRELFANAAPEVPFIRGNRGFVPETLLAYELGWRIQPIEKLSLSLSTFYNFYDNIRSVEPATPDRPITFSNGVRGQSYGLELSAAYQLREWWRLRGGYTAFGKELAVKPGSIDLNRASAESNDPRHQFVLQSSMNLPGRLELGLVFRYVDKLPRPYVSEYGEMDARLAWKFSRSLEISVVGQSLVNEYHSEFIPASPSPRKLARSVYGKIICRI